jgi:hypothetical protein
MSEEIFVNTGTSFQQPYIARQPAIGTTPAIGTVPARTPTNVQTPFTYSNRSPFTYQANRNAQSPYIANAQQPYPYIASNQTPYIASAQQPYPYIANARQPYPYIANARQPNIYQHVTNQQTPYIANARQPNIYQHVTNQQTPFIGQARQPNIYQHVTNQQTPFIGQARQPAIYQHVTTQQTPFTFDIRSPSIGSARQPSIANSRSPTITTVQQTITETNINNSAQAELEVYRSSSSNFILSTIEVDVKFVFSNGTTNGSGNTARKISLYMQAVAVASGTGYSTPSGVFSGMVLMGEWETPSGFAPDSYSIELTGETQSGSGFGVITRNYDLGNPSGVTYGITKAYLDADQTLTWGWTNSGFGYRTRYFTECNSSQKFITTDFALSFQKSGYPDIVVDTFKSSNFHAHTHTGSGGGGCF